MATNYILRFDSLAQTIAKAEERIDRVHGEAFGNSVTDWTDNYSFDEFVEHFRTLQAKNVRAGDCINITNMLKKHVESYKNHFMPQNVFEEIHDTGGDMVDIGRYLAHDPECMITFGDRTPKRAINLFFQISGNSEEDRIISNIGLITYCLNNVLANRTVNVYGICGTANHTNSDRMYFLVPFITSNYTAMIPQVQLCLLNLRAFQRRIMFAIREGFPADVKRIFGVWPNNGYGHSFDIESFHIYRHFKLIPDLLISRSDFNDDLSKMCEKLIEKLVEVKNNIKKGIEQQIPSGSD